MSASEKIALQEAYEAKYQDGLGELATAELMWSDRFWELVSVAIGRGTPITRNELERAFPDASWDE